MQKKERGEAKDKRFFRFEALAGVLFRGSLIEFRTILRRLNDKRSWGRREGSKTGRCEEIEKSLFPKSLSAVTTLPLFSFRAI